MRTGRILAGGRRPARRLARLPEVAACLNGRRRSRCRPKPTLKPAGVDGPALADPSALARELLGPDGRLFVLSNRGPITFDEDPRAPGGLTADRGAGGLVTALGELGRHAPVTWIAATLDDGDRAAAPYLDAAATPAAVRELVAVGPGLPGRGGNGRRREDRPDDRAARVQELVGETLPDQDVRLRYITLPEDVFEGYYRVFANPFLWFIQHQMYQSAYGPNVDAALLDAWRAGYRAANERLGDAAVDAAAGEEAPVFLVQDYHLYLAPARIRERLPNATILHFTHIPWPPRERVADASAGHAAGDLRGPARVRHRRPADRPLRVPLPRHRRELRARREGGRGRPVHPVARPADPGPQLPDLGRSRAA